MGASAHPMTARSERRDERQPLPGRAVGVARLVTAEARADNDTGGCRDCSAAFTWTLLHKSALLLHDEPLTLCIPGEII